MASMNERQTLRLDQGWELVEKGITKLQNILEGQQEQPFKSDEFMMIYATIYNMCTQKPPHDYSQQLYEKYQQEIEAYLSTCVLPSLKTKHNEILLREFMTRWTNHKVMVQWFSRVFHYLDRYFISCMALLPLTEVGHRCFRDLVYEGIKANIRDAVISLINQEREGEQIDKALLKNVLDIFIETGRGELVFYKKDFEVYLFKDTGLYYARKALNWIWEDSSEVEDRYEDYMLKAEQCLNKEMERTSQYLHSSSWQNLMEKIEHELFAVYSSQLLERELSHCQALLKDEKMEELSGIYKHRKAARFLEPIANVFKEHITAEGATSITQAEDALCDQDASSTYELQQVLVRQIIKLHEKYVAYVTYCFSNHFLFHKALSEAFRTFLNRGFSGVTSGEMVAIFCNDILRKGGGEKMVDEAMEAVLEKVVQLVGYISDKDLFAEFYRKNLSRRLLFGQSANNEHEKCMLTKLKQKFGGYMTSKMEGMVMDLELTKDMKANFDEYIVHNPSVNPKVDLNVAVLTTGFWPSIRSSDLSLPFEMAKCVSVFEEFFQIHRKHRRLSWIYSLGTCSLNGKFNQKNIDLVVSTYQAAVLLLFNESERLGFADITKILNLNEPELRRVLHSLSCMKLEILKKHPDHPGVKTIVPTDYFEVNVCFTSKMRRIKVPLPVIEERRKTVEDVERDRRYAIDASLVRIMKMRKSLQYQQLMAECVEKLSSIFKPEMKIIKRQIEDLIYREFIERDEENPCLLRYLN